MPYSAAQTARLQSDVDSLPKCLIAGDIDELAGKFATNFRKASDLGVGDRKEILLAACSGLEMVGKKLYEEGGTPGPSGIYTYCKGSDGYTDFLRAYAGAYRAWDDVVYANTSNWASDLIKGTKQLLKDVKEGATGLVEDAGASTGKALWGALWPIFALIGGLLVAIVIIAIVTKGKISLS